jgi:5-methylcytosine-specific restriction endonuclease McrA
VATCKRGHVGAPRFKNGQCAECKKITDRESCRRRPEAQRAANRRWRLKNPEKVTVLSRAKHAKHRARERMQSAVWRYKNRERAVTNSAVWFKKHPGYRREWWRRDVEQNRVKSCIKGAHRRAMKFMQRCGCCKDSKIAELFSQAKLVGGEVDHKIPLTLGGHHCIKNLQPLAYEAHREKTGLDLAAIAAAKRRSVLLRRWGRVSIGNFS